MRLKNEIFILIVDIPKYFMFFSAVVEEICFYSVFQFIFTGTLEGYFFIFISDLNSLFSIILRVDFV